MNLMDTKFSIFGIRFGIDPILDFWPWFGSFVGVFVSCYLFFIAYKLHVPTKVYLKMSWHILLDFLFGELPFIGFIFDLFYRANEKNLALLTLFVDPEVLEGVVIDESLDS